MTPKNAFWNLATYLRLNPREYEVMKGRLGVKGKILTRKEIGISMGVCRERIRQIEANVYRRDPRGLCEKFMADYPAVKLRSEPRVLGKVMILQWIRDSGAAYCSACKSVVNDDDFSLANHICKACQRKRFSVYQKRNRKRLTDLSKKYYALGYCRDKLAVKRMMPS